MRFGDYGEYLKRRWDELGGEAATEAVRRSTGARTERDMPWNTDPVRAQFYADQFRAAQCAIFVEIAGELHHTFGHADVGLGRKPSGNHYESASGPVATDIIVLKDLDGGAEVQLIDCFSSMAGPESKPRWDAVEPNSDRTWVQPPVPAGAQPQPSPEPAPEPVAPPSDAVLEAIAALDRKVDALRQNVEALRGRPFPSYSATLFGQRITFTPKP